MTVTISRLYNSYDEAREAIRSLEAAGVASGDISVVASNADNWYSENGNGRGATARDTIVDRDLDGKDDHAEAAATGAGVGATAGGVAGLLAGLGIIAIPGVGPVVAAGWLVAMLAGAATGGVAGGIIGPLTQTGLSKEDAEVYAEGIRRGGAVVTARVKDADAPKLQSIMDRSAVNVRERAAAYRDSGWQSFDPALPRITKAGQRLRSVSTSLAWQMIGPIICSISKLLKNSGLFRHQADGRTSLIYGRFGATSPAIRLPGQPRLARVAAQQGQRLWPP